MSVQDKVSYLQICDIVYILFRYSNDFIPNRLDCLKKMQSREADFGYFEAEDLKVAALFFGNEQQVVLQACEYNLSVV